MILGHALPHPTGIIALADDEGSGGTYRKMSEEGPSPSPEDVAWFSLRQDPPPVPDRPDVEGEIWKEDLDLAHLTPQERKNVYQMLGTHRSMWDGRLGHVQTTSHRIELVPDARPVHAQPYRAGSRAREAESSEVQRMLKAGFIEPTASEWASPVVLVPKPDGSMRFCIDYRRLNALTVRDSYPLPRMEECIDSLGDATIFSTLDCNSGYWQIPVHPDDRAKTTFTSQEGFVPFLTDAVRVTECAGNFPAVRGYHAGRFDVENMSRLSGRHYYFLQNQGRTFVTSGCGSTSSLSRRIIPEPKKMLFFS